MLVEQGHSREGPGARLALVFLDIRVGLEMGSQVGAVSKGAAAVGAGEGLLAGVGPDVALQQPGPGEGLPAGATHAGQRVASDVHLESTQADILLVAVFAVEGLARLGVFGHGETGQLLGQLAQAWEGSITLGLQGGG